MKIVNFFCPVQRLREESEVCWGDRRARNLNLLGRLCHQNQIHLPPPCHCQDSRPSPPQSHHCRPHLQTNREELLFQLVHHGRCEPGLSLLVLPVCFAFFLCPAFFLKILVSKSSKWWSSATEVWKSAHRAFSSSCSFSMMLLLCFSCSLLPCSWDCEETQAGELGSGQEVTSHHSLVYLL